MRTSMTPRTKVALLVGFVIFATGAAGAAFLGSRGSSQSSGGAAKVDVLYTAGPIGAGTSGPTALEQGLIRTKKVASGSQPAGALTDPSMLTGLVAVTPVPQGAIVTGAMFSTPQTHIGTVVIPAGKRALALELAPVPGVAGFAGAGDHVDVFGVAKGEGTAQGVRLVLQSVEVLNVNGAGLPTAQGQPGSPNLIYLLAVTPTQAERLIFMTEFEKLYFDLVPKGEAPVTTPGAGPTQTLQVL